MKDMALWNEGDWIAAVAVVVLGMFLAGGAAIAVMVQNQNLSGAQGEISGVARLLCVLLEVSLIHI